MSPQAIVDPEELEGFALSLSRFNSQLADSTQSLTSQFARLGESWRDQQQQGFEAIFADTVRTLRQFMQAAEEQIPYLQKKAAEARQYLQS